MANENRRSGVLYVKLDSKLLDVAGEFTYNLGKPKRDAKVGHDRVHGYKELPQVPYVEGTITDSSTLDLETDILGITNATVTLELANGKTVVLRNAWYAGEGNVTTEEAEIAVRFEGMSAEEI
jgi:hypothetical protein